MHDYRILQRRKFIDQIPCVAARTLFKLTCFPSRRKFFEQNMRTLSRFMSSALSRLNEEDLIAYNVLLSKIYSAYSEELFELKEAANGGNNV